MRRPIRQGDVHDAAKTSANKHIDIPKLNSHIVALAQLQCGVSASLRLRVFMRKRYQHMDFSKLGKSHRLRLWDGWADILARDAKVLRQIIKDGVLSGEFHCDAVGIDASSQLILCMLAGMDEGIIVFGDCPPGDGLMITITDFILRFLSSNA